MYNHAGIHAKHILFFLISDSHCATNTDILVLGVYTVCRLLVDDVLGTTVGPIFTGQESRA
jgi:hypothetical protein